MSNQKRVRRTGTTSYASAAKTINITQRVTPLKSALIEWKPSKYAKQKGPKR